MLAVAAAVVLHAGDSVAIAGETFAMPVDGWTFTHGAHDDTLEGAGAKIAVTTLTTPCAKWTGSALAPAWAPTMFWPYASTAGGLCVQRVDRAIGVMVALIATPGAGEPNADALRVLTAIGDALRPPAQIEGMSLRLPMAVAPQGDHKLTASDGATTFEITLAVTPRSCGGALAAATGDRVDDDAPAPWRAHRVHADDHTRVSCAELGDRGVALTWPAGHDALRATTMRAIAAAALAAWGPATTNSTGEISVLGAPLRLESATAGEWKVIATSAQTTELALLGDDLPFALQITRDGGCAAGEPMPDENTRGFAPSSFAPVQRVASPPRFAICVRSPRGNASIAIEPLAPAGEPPSGSAAVHVHTLLLELARRYYDRPDVATASASVLSAAPAHVDPPAETHTTYRADGAFYLGGIALTPPAIGASSADGGGMIGADVRGVPHAGIGLAAEVAGEAGYANGYQYQARGALGVGVGIGALGVVALVGGDGGTIGAGGNDLLGEAEATFQLGPVRLLGSALRTHAFSGADQWRYELRAAWTPTTNRGTVLAGVQWFRFDGNGDATATAGKAIVIYVGVGFASDIGFGDH